MNFNPRPPCGERPNHITAPHVTIDFNPRPPCGERLGGSKCSYRSGKISIHAPHAGSDRVNIKGELLHLYFNPRPHAGSDKFCLLGCNFFTISIHAPHAGSDPDSVIVRYYVFNFNPRPPCGERLIDPQNSKDVFLYFNPRPPCGERPLIHLDVLLSTQISIHAPHAGSDWKLSIRKCMVTQFQSTPPMRGATTNLIKMDRQIVYFNPRPPCGERLQTT